MGIVSFLSYWTYFPEDQLRYALCLFGLYPLCIFYRGYIEKISRKNSEIIKHLFSILFGMFCCIYCFGLYTPIHSLFTSCVVYAILKWFPKRAGSFTFVFCMLYVFALHINRMWYHWMVYTLDVTGTQMLLTIKLTSFAFEYSDTHKESEEFHEESQTAAPLPRAPLPSLLEWYGFVYFFPSFLVGPVVSYKKYISFVRNKHDKCDKHDKCGKSDATSLTHDNIRVDTAKCNTNTTPLTNSLPVLLVALALIVVLYCRRYFPIEYMLTDQYAEQPFVNRIVLMYITQLIIRCKYYFAWVFAYACFITCGITSRQQHDSVGMNVSPFDIEFAQNAHQITNNWNLCTNEWLKVHVYQRAAKLGFSKQKSTYITNVVSALWHGFYPGYLMTFITGGVLTDLGRQIRKNVRPYFLENKVAKIVYDIVCTIVMMIIVGYTTLPFQVYSFYNSMLVWYRVYFIGHALIIGAYILLYVLKKYDGVLKKYKGVFKNTTSKQTKLP